MTKVGHGKELVAEAGRLLVRVDRALATASWEDGLATRVERLLRSAAPGTGMRYWYDLRDTYRLDIEAGSPEDEVWCELFARPPETHCGCSWALRNDCAEARHWVSRCDVLGLDERHPSLVGVGVSSWNDEVLRLQDAGVLPVGRVTFEVSWTRESG